MLIQRYLYTYWYLYLSQISRRSLQNLCFYRSTLRYYKAYTYYGFYTCSEVSVGTTEILQNVYWYCGTYPYTEVPVSTTKLILVLRILYLYYEVYPGLTELILVLLNLFLYFRSYTCITELIHVFQILYLSYRTYTCISDLILVLRSIYLSYGSYTYAKVPVGTISRNRSESYHLQGQICKTREIPIFGKRVKS